MKENKLALYQACLEFVQQRIQTAEMALEQAREASNDDTKSSAGDKFETTREMMQQDISRNKSLLADARQQLQLLEAVRDIPAGTQIRNGSLVYTDNGIFYISISAGQLKGKGQQVFAISAISPIGKLLMGKKTSESFSFNKSHYTIRDIA